LKNTLWISNFWIFIVLIQVSSVMAQRYDEKGVYINGQTLFWKKPDINGKDYAQMESIKIASHFTGLRQLKNSELDSVEGNQWHYNESLKMLLWNFSQIGWRDWINDNLDMSGLQKLEWVVKTNKTIYQSGEPIGIKVSLRNICSEDVDIWSAQAHPGFFLNSTKIVKIWKDIKRDAYLTQEGCRHYFDLLSRSPYRQMGGVILKPGDEIKVYHPQINTLNPYYDLSEPGEYELTFYTRNFLADDEHQIGEFPKPCTIRFKIEGNTNWLDSQVVWPEDEK